MRMIASGIYQLDEGESDEGYQAARERTHEIIDAQRKRLTDERPEYPWWADVVFAVRDIRSICTLMQINGDPTTADALAEIVAVSVTNLLKHFFKGDTAMADKVRGELIEENERLDAYLTKEIEKLQGAKEQ